MSLFRTLVELEGCDNELCPPIITISVSLNKHINYKYNHQTVTFVHVKQEEVSYYYISQYTVKIPDRYSTVTSFWGT
jgi:hypothetical protein